MGEQIMARRHQDWWDKTFKDSRGNYAVWQMPNIWLIGWAVFTIISLLLNGTFSDVLSWLATASLGVWAILEVTKGVNYFRRALGLLVLLFTIASVIKSLH